MKRSVQELFWDTKDPVCSEVVFWAGIFALFHLACRGISGAAFGFQPAASAAAGTLIGGFAGCLLHETLRTVLVRKLARTRLGFWGAGLFVTAGFCAALLPWQQLLAAGKTPLELCTVLVGQVLPALAGSALLTALALRGGLPAALIYTAALWAAGHLLPWQPAAPQQMAALMELLLPAMFLIVLDCALTEEPEPGAHSRRLPLGWFSAAAAAVLLVCFFRGLLPWQPVAIATGSMEPQINTGDLVIVSRPAAASIQVGDVIQFAHGQYTVVHRVAEVVEGEDGVAYITRGDANNADDAGTVAASQVIGKVVARIPWAGWLTLWLHASG